MIERRQLRPKRGLWTATTDSLLVVLDLDRETYFALDEVGALVWNLLSAGSTVEDIVRQVACEYSMPPECVGADVSALLEKLIRLKLVRAS